MAETVDPEEFKGWRNRGEKTTYPWVQWLDGQIWRLVQDQDFTEPLATFRAKANYYCYSLHPGARVRTRAGEPGVLYIQRIPRVRSQ